MIYLRALWRLVRAVAYLLRLSMISSWRFGSRDRHEQRRLQQRWALGLLRRLGLSVSVEGEVLQSAKLVVANHISWLDIMAICAAEPCRFVSKADVAEWPVVGRIVTRTGTLYVDRTRRRDAMRVLGDMAGALRGGDTVAVFPEGTTSDGLGVMPFHANLLQAAIEADVPLQAFALRYSESDHAVTLAASYAGDTSLPVSLWRVVTATGLHVRVTVLPPVAPAHGDRRALAAGLREQISLALA